MKRLVDQVWHWMRRMEFISAEVINAETGTMDFDCRCCVCRWIGWLDG
jgi:hypothetical protein